MHLNVVPSRAAVSDCQHVVGLSQMLKGVLMGLGHSTQSNEQGQEPIGHVRPFSHLEGFFEVALAFQDVQLRQHKKR